MLCIYSSGDAAVAGERILEHVLEANARSRVGGSVYQLVPLLHCERKVMW